jgi:methylmalonyl-CoA/ethylmalonyl-CoA epimerase
LTDTAARLGFKLLHVGVAVPALEAATESLSTLFGYKVVAGPFNDPIQKVAVNFLSASGSDAVAIELIAPLGDDSPIQSMLAKTGGGAYHLCFETEDLEAALAHVASNGCVVVAQPVPAIAFEGRRIAWIYTPARQLFELVEARATG